MNKLFLSVALALATAATCFGQPFPTITRTLQQYSALLTVGDSAFSPANWGVAIRNLNLFDGRKTDGFYYSMLSGAILHSVDSIPLADLRIVGLGWRGNPLTTLGSRPPFDFSLDVSLAPTAELRLKPQQIALDSASLAAGATLGFYVSLGDNGDLGVSWEPVVDLGLLHWGNRNVPNANYSDFVVSWVVKTANETRDLPWCPEAP